MTKRFNILIDEATKKMKNPCWKGYKPIGTKKKDGREVPNCVPVKEAATCTKVTRNSQISGL